MKIIPLRRYNSNGMSQNQVNSGNKSGVDSLNQLYNKASLFIENNKKALGIGTLVVLLLVFGGWAYKQFIMLPKQTEAQNAMIDAQHYFEADSFALALNGRPGEKGFKQIIDEYGSTPAGKAAQFYAGVSSLQLGKFKEAIAYLEDFSTEDPALNARKYGCLGDAKAELKEFDAAAEYYQKAVDAHPKDEMITPTYLYRLAKLKEKKNDIKGAIEVYNRIEGEFFGSFESQLSERDIARLEAIIK